MTYLLKEHFGEIVLVRINRPEVLNALNRCVLEELYDFLDAMVKQKQIKAVILTGAGDKAFIAGADIREMHSFDQAKMVQFCELGQKVALLLEQAPFLTLAAVNGYALGGGLELALACDFMYASATAKLGLPEVRLGLIPGFGGTQRLARAVGMRLAKEILMSGKILSAAEAQSIGIVNCICEGDSLLESCLKTARTIVAHSFTAVIQAKNAVNCSNELAFFEALEREKELCALCFSTKERAASMVAFLNKKAER